MNAPAIDPRREDRTLGEAEGREFLKGQRFANVATTTEDGWPYVIPLTYVYEGGDRVWFHTGDRSGQGRGLFHSCIRRDPRVCFTACEIGDLHPGRPYACNSAQVYASVVCFGTVTIVEDSSKKEWFFDRLIEKHGPPGGVEFEQPGYPIIDRIVLYELAIERLTHKRSVGIRH
jgi:uncharacterized protein